MVLAGAAKEAMVAGGRATDFDGEGPAAGGRGGLISGLYP